MSTKELATLLKTSVCFNFVKHIGPYEIYLANDKIFLIYGIRIYVAIAIHTSVTTDYRHHIFHCLAITSF